MKKFLHIITTGNLTVARRYPWYINESFDKRDHNYLIIGNNIEKKELPDNSEQLNCFNNRVVKSCIKNSEHVFFHSFCMSAKLKVWFLFHRKQFKKVVWIEWGMDLYEDKHGKTLLRKGLYLIDQHLKKNVRVFVGIFPMDCMFYKRKYPATKAKVFYAPYSIDNENSINKVFLTHPVGNSLKRKTINGKTINLLIGHQANPKLNHCEIIDYISRFKDENIQVYIPLSYGDKKYADEVSEYAIQMLGDKVYIIRDYMSLDEYMSVLEKMDIAIFHVERQIALGNILPLIYLQKKIYLKSSGVMYEYFHGMSEAIQKSDDLIHITYEQLVADVDMASISKIIHTNVFDFESNKKRWEDIFNTLNSNEYLYK